MTFEIIEGGTTAPSIDFPFAACLDRGGRRKLRAFSALMVVRKGDIVARDGEISENFVAVASGTVKLTKALPDGRRQIVAFKSAGDILTLHRGGIPWPVTIQAICECSLLRIQWAALDDLARQVPAIDRALLDLANDQVASLQRHLLTLGRKTIEEKVATFLLEVCRPATGQSTPGREFHLPMRRRDIADYLGLTTESVCREINRLKRDGIISLARPSRIIVLDWLALEHLAQGGAPRGIQERREAAG